MKKITASFPFIQELTKKMSTLLTSTDDKAFSKSTHPILLQRLKLISIALVILHSFYFLSEIVLFKDVTDLDYRFNLFLIHLISFLLSCFYLIIFPIFKKINSFANSSWPEIIITAYLAGYLLLGAIASINSQRLTGNIDTYIMVLISVAAIFPIRPKNYFYILLGTHSIFMILLPQLSEDPNFLLTKQINTTSTVVISFLIVLSFYSYRKNGFQNTQKLKENEENFRSLFEINPFPLILSRVSDGKIILINQKALDFYQLSSAQIQTIDANLVLSDASKQEGILAKLYQSGSIKNHMTQHKVANMPTKWIMVNYELIEYDHQACILTGITDVSDLKEIEDELTKHASTDMLTGVWNRRRGLDLLENELQKAEQQEVEFIVCFIDINNLKQVNDLHGHTEGDQLINRVCQVINQNIAQEDVLFRFGGDEFIILFFNKQMSTVHGVWEEIEHSFREINAKKSLLYPLSVSYGFYHYQSGMGVSLEEIIRFADKDMYTQKAFSKKE